MNYAFKTVGPGNPSYSAPEAWYPGLHSPKMDIFSYGMLLVEICLREIPDECSIEKKEACPDDRPNMSDKILEHVLNRKCMLAFQ